MLLRISLAIALLAGLALFIQAPAQASDRDGYYYGHDRRAELYQAPMRNERPRYYRPAPVYYAAPRYRHERYRDDRYRHEYRHHHHRHHRDYGYRDRRW
ncbi:hypothetical protein KRX52_14750 [Pseudomonas sp. MAP12]|uniref:Uncharacterized protein n=1 Tax=Geopseudomonas aromaticivorans TaxID=2849492 RepID=A0ABS6MYZ8_9GAMM|nr:hypothetical protein [Pseudomonas aromaticivorans]MBV2134037.1 hypothetical protein [Pseudomonas aromaticivorans]